MNYQRLEINFDGYNIIFVKGDKCGIAFAVLDCGSQIDICYTENLEEFNQLSNYLKHKGDSNGLHILHIGSNVVLLNIGPGMLSAERFPNFSKSHIFKANL